MDHAQERRAEERRQEELVARFNGKRRELEDRNDKARAAIRATDAFEDDFQDRFQRCSRIIDRIGAMDSHYATIVNNLFGALQSTRQQVVGHNDDVRTQQRNRMRQIETEEEELQQWFRRECKRGNR